MISQGDTNSLSSQMLQQIQLNAAAAAAAAVAANNNSNQLNNLLLTNNTGTYARNASCLFIFHPFLSPIG